MSSESVEWPANAVPEHWVTALFEKMANSYGARFLDLWRGVDMHAVRREWGIALAKLSPAELRAGVSALWTCKYPPVLSEFVQLCKQTRAVEAASTSAPRLTDQTRASPEVVAANRERMREFLRTVNATRNPGSEWARKLLERGTSRSGLPLTPEVIRCATDALRAHSRGRTPGDDDGDAP